MTSFRAILLVMVLICAIAVSLTRNLLMSIIIYMAFSLIMAVIWLTLQAPDLAITEAAVGAGVTGILFFVTLKKIHSIRTTADKAAPDELQENASEDKDNE